jgi:hypothetical protein
LLDHLCWAWNMRDVAPSDFGQVSDDDFAAHSNAVPNFGFTRKISDNVL